MRISIFGLLVGILILGAATAQALINPKLQPRHIYELRTHVLICHVTKVDADLLTVNLNVTSVVKGDFAPRQIVMKAEDSALLEAVLALEPGQPVVAYAGKRRPQSEQLDVLYYAGGGKWYKARMAAEDRPGEWQLLADADEGVDAKSEAIMFGVFNGAVEQLVAMMHDLAAGRAYFPAKPFTHFSASKIASLGGAIRGVALFDFSGDGRLDILACCDTGNRVYVQSETGAFDERTESWGLAGTKSMSCSLADANADGLPDLLLDATLYLNSGGRWKSTGALPSQKATVLSAAFVEIDGDGYPDVVVSRSGAGLAAFRNPFGSVKRKDDIFLDMTVDLGLDREELGAGGHGYFEPGDWNGDGRTDLLYLAGAGRLLLAGDKIFKAEPFSNEGDALEFNAAAMTCIVQPDRAATFVAAADSKRLVEFNTNGCSDITRFGNEILDDISGMFMPVAEDFNADGTIDIYATTHAKGPPSFYIANRGYGSFMLEEKYNAGKTVPSGVYNLAAHGLAAGDATGDGANDLLVAGLDGTLWLLINETLKDRKPAPEMDTPLDERKQIEARLVTVRVTGKTGVVGCNLRLKDAAGRLVAARQIGGNVGAGCCGPHQVTFAVREPGPHILETVFADGRRTSQAVDLSLTQARHQSVVSAGPSGK